MESSGKNPSKKPSLLALVPLRSAAKNNKQLQGPLEVKQFPIVLGRTNLSQWWYQSCDCQQYYCRLHCRPVAQNIGSLSKVMIQIDTQGVAHIVGKNPHLVTILSPDRNHEQKAGDEGRKEADDHQQQQPIALRPRDIVSIGRRDREPWMRFQVVETEMTHISKTKAEPTSATLTNYSQLQSKATKSVSELTSPSGLVQVGMPEATKALQPTENEPPKDSVTSPRHHDAQLPEWITTTRTKSGSGKRSNPPYNNFDRTEDRQQEEPLINAETLTKAAVAAGAAADADERKKKQYRHNSYYENEYNALRKRRRHNNSSSAIRSAENLFHNPASRRGGRLQGHNPQIHFVFQDYETSARLVRQGTRRWRSSTPTSKGPHDNQERMEQTPHETRLARSDRNFIGKPKERNVSTAHNGNGSNTREGQETIDELLQQQTNSMGMLSKSYTAALLEANVTSKMTPKVHVSPMDAPSTSLLIQEDLQTTDPKNES